jgi:putative spermidine/putrescine transport system substrate-binding protein
MKRALACSTCLIAVILAALLAGCGGSDGDSTGGGSSEADTSSSSDATASAENATEKPATKPDRLVVRFAGSDYGELMERTVVANFTEETGIPVTVDNTEEYTAFAKNDQALEAGQRPPVDCQIQNQPYAYLDAIHDFSLPISPEVAPNLEAVEAAVAQPTGLELNDDGSWPYVGIYQLSVPFVEDADAIPADAVTSWLDLKDPSLKKSMAIDGAYQSSAFGIAAALGIEVTEDPASLDPVWEFLHSIRDNRAVLGTSVDTVRALSSGQVKLAITPPLDGISAEKEGVKIRFVPPKEGMVVVTDSFYINANIPQNVYYYCQKFANVMLDPEVQAEWADTLGLVPVNGEAKLPTFMSEHPDVFPITEQQIEAANGIRAPVPLQARNQAVWQEEFENALK